MAGFENDVLVCENVNFNPALAKPHPGLITTDGELIIGSTALNPGGTHLNIGTITSNSLTVGYSSPNITLETNGGGSPIEQVTLDNSTAPGTNPVLPTGTGNLTITGAQVANASLANVIQTHSFAPNSFAVSIQRSATSATTNSTKNGVSHFDSTDFSVDSNGFVELSNSGRFPITPYVVGPIGQAGYQTIQSALTAANAAGGGMVWVQPGTYTEDLTCYDNVEIIGTCGEADAGNITIDGTHIPPSTGTFAFTNLILKDASAIINTAAAGTAQISFKGCVFEVTNGYVINAINWNGSFRFDDCGNNSTNDGIINNSVGTSTIFTNNSLLGAGSGQTCNLNGTVRFDLTEIACPLNITGSGTNEYNLVFLANISTFGGTSINSIGFGSGIFGTITTSGTSIVSIIDSTIETGASAAISHGSAGIFELFNSTINSSNNPAIAGAGAGILTYSDIVFLSNAAFAGTLTLATVSWRPYAQAIASTNGTKVGTCAFDSADFNVDANGFVTLSGSSGFIWTEIAVVGPTSMVTNNGYVANNGASVGFTLPVTAAFGTIIRVSGKGAGGWSIGQNAGQSIVVGNVTSTVGVGGSVASTQASNCIELLCTTADTVWTALSMVGAISVT